MGGRGLRRKATAILASPQKARKERFVDKPLVCQRGLPGRLSTHRAALTLARCSVAAHYASLRVLATSALRASDGQRPGRECIFTFRTALALRRRGVPCLRTSCARHFSPSGLRLFASICSAKNARNDVHAVISDLSLVLPILCQCSAPAVRPSAGGGLDVDGPSIDGETRLSTPKRLAEIFASRRLSKNQREGKALSHFNRPRRRVRRGARRPRAVRETGRSKPNEAGSSATLR